MLYVVMGLFAFPHAFLWAKEELLLSLPLLAPLRILQSH